MKRLLLPLILFSVISIYAAPFNGRVMQFSQPDGSSVDVKLYGTEYYMRGEGLDGYTVVRDQATQWICYAVLTANGHDLVSSGIHYTGQQRKVTSNTHPRVVQHLDITDQARESVILKNKHKLGEGYLPSVNSKTAIHPVIGNIKGLCVVVDFSDEQGVLPMSEFFDFCNNMNYSNFGNNGSLKTFYHDVSGGLVEYENVVYGYYRAPLTFAAYDAMPYATGAQQVLGLALNWIASQGFDFSTLSINPDGSIMAINLMYTGNPPNWAQGMWWHQGSYNGFSANGVHSDAYNCSPANSPLELATVAHENGHMIGKWPDTYKYNSNTGPDGIGSFDLMCAMGDYTNPVPPNPHFRSNASWGRVVDVSNFNGLIHDTANSMTCYKYINMNDTNEFFLLESRIQGDRSASIPDEGLTIWHIDRNGDNQTTHHEVYLVHANNDIQNHYGACYKAGFNTEYGAASTPNSALFNGNPSGLRAWEIGPVGTIMTYKLGTGFPSPAFHLTYVNITGDNNGNGFLEPGETGNVNVTASNLGQVNSGVAVVGCTAIGVNSGLVTVNTLPVTAGVLAVSGMVPVAFNLAISPSAQIGNEIELKFEISDGNFSTYITRKIIIGEMVIINNQQVTTCSAVFYDHGGPYSNYMDLTDYTVTFLSPSVNQAINADFLTFELEDEPNCAYDYLKIYNGPNTSSTLMGTYCGTNSPGNVVSTDPSGALTFKFHADEGVSAAGWSAIITCTPVNGIDEHLFDNLLIYPNPSAGIFTVSHTGNKQISISVEDILGQIVYQSGSDGNHEFQVDLGSGPSGLFMIKVRSGKEIYSEKIMIYR